MATRKVPINELSLFAQRLRRARSDAGLSTEQLAELAGCHRSHISGIENDHTRGSDAFLDCLCKALPEAAKDLRSLRRSRSQGSEVDRTRGLSPKLRPRGRQGRDAKRLGGDWYACWQTSENRREASRMEPVEIVVPSSTPRFQMSSVMRTETSWDTSAWEARCQISVEHWVMGEYAVKDGPRINGMLRLKLDAFFKSMVGLWVGVSPDSDETCGVLVLGRSEEQACQLFDEARLTHQGLPLIRDSHLTVFAESHHGSLRKERHADQVFTVLPSDAAG